MFRTFRKVAILELYILTLVSQLADAFSNGIAVLYAIELGANVFEINLINTISSSMSIIVQLPFGILSDRLGRRPMLLIIRMIIAIATLLRIFSTQPIHLILVSVIGGVNITGFLPIIVSMIGDVAEREERQEAMSTMYLFSGLGMLVSPTICAALLLIPSVNLRNMYEITFILQLISIAYVAARIKETKPKTDVDTTGSFSRYLKELLRQREFVGLSITQFLYSFSQWSLMTYLQIYGKVGLKLSDAEVASFNIYFSLATMLTRLILATFLTRVASRPAYVSFILLNTIGSTFAIFTNSYTTIVLILFLIGMSWGGAKSLSSVLVTNLSTNENRGAANSILQLFESTGGALIVGTSPITAIFGFTSVFILIGIISSASTLPQLLRIKRKTSEQRLTS